MIVDNVTFTAIFRVDKFTVTFKNGNTTVATQEVQNGGYATAPTFNADTFLGWTVDGKTVVNLAIYKITATTTFTAKHGTWQELNGDMQYVSGSPDTNSTEIYIHGLKVGDKIKITANYILANIKDNGHNSFWYNSDGNSCYGWVYQGNSEWYKNMYDGDGGGMPDDMELSSLTPTTTTLGLLDYGTENEFTITISCKRDNYLTIEWSDSAGFYIEFSTMWYLYVLR